MVLKRKYIIYKYILYNKDKQIVQLGMYWSLIYKNFGLADSIPADLLGLMIYFLSNFDSSSSY